MSLVLTSRNGNVITDSLFIFYDHYRDNLQVSLNVKLLSGDTIKRLSKARQFRYRDQKFSFL
jgi:hypothetical protein